MEEEEEDGEEEEKEENEGNPTYLVYIWCGDAHFMLWVRYGGPPPAQPLWCR